ncbi:MAG TPA: hypothetical protein VI039_13000 [Solirubrobacterales bacterium]
MPAKTTYGFTDLKQGSIWESYRSTVVNNGELVGRYELTDAGKTEALKGGGQLDSVVHLTNLETGGGRKGLLEGVAGGTGSPAAPALEVGQVNPFTTVALAWTLNRVVALVAWCSLVDRELIA